MFELESHGPDTFVGTGPQYPWGGLYGGQIVAQALRAASESVDDAFVAHSIRAYFIRPGDHLEPVRYEVDRIRNGRSFVTRRVVARQAIGAILNAECSFQRPEDALSRQTIVAPKVPSYDSILNSSFSEHFDRRSVASGDVSGPLPEGSGRQIAWMKSTTEIDDTAASLILHQCWVTFMSDDLPTDCVRNALVDEHPEFAYVPSASLDHTIWFHRPFRADRWHLHDFTCHHVSNSRGLAVGHVFSETGEHVVSITQEVLIRAPRT
ncbi:MAG TPA: acyl-CoA thioesterase domain-containing protein [Ilumatobacter sp.]|nr:acyl-CoA thioesterase domain-containing protein [Ilumatobacter sp.]